MSKTFVRRTAFRARQPDHGLLEGEAMSEEKPGRRAFLKWGLASAGVPLASSALAFGGLGEAKAEPPATPADAPASGESGGATVSLAAGVQLYYKDEWLGAPWLTGEPAVFLHGNLETHEIWYRWVPRMAQQFRLLRPDLPGFGRSTAPRDFEWSLSNYAKLVANFLDAIGASSAHIIGAKTGGAIAMQFAATYPQRTRTLLVASGPFTSGAPGTDDKSQQVRLGSAATKEEMAYFDKLRDETPPETRKGVGEMMAKFNLEPLLPKISAPTLVITSDRSKLQSVDTVLRYQPKIPHSRLLVVTSDAYHVAVANANECVTSALAFIRESAGRTGSGSAGRTGSGKAEG
jgi:3-oxoadipate enol-lactonase